MSKPQKPDAIALLAAMNVPEPVAVTPVPAPLVRAQTRKPKSGARAGTRLIAGHFPEATLKALKHLMAEEDATLQALLEEAIHDLLTKKGMTKFLNA